LQVATTMSFMAYELVANPDIQQKLYEEISDIESQLDGKKITYEQIQGLKYLDQVICETLRKWPAAGVRILLLTLIVPFIKLRLSSSGYRSKLHEGF
jgi:cytochrome P450